MSLNDGLLAYYRLEEASGARVDALGGVSLSLNGTLARRLVKINYGVDLINNASYLYRADHEDLRWEGTRNRTFSFAFTPDTIAGVDTFLSKWANPLGRMQDWIVYRNAAKLIFACAGSSTAITSTVNLVAGQTYHVVITLADNHVAKMYIDGVLQNSFTSGTPSGTRSDLYIGQNSNTNYADGGFDEFGIWGVTLTDVQVAELFNSGDLLAYPFPIPPPPVTANGNFFPFFNY